MIAADPARRRQWRSPDSGGIKRDITMYSSRVLVGLSLMLVNLAGAVAEGAEPPPRTAGGQGLVVPEKLLDTANIYYVMPGEDAQLVITSDALLQRTVLTCRRIVGFVATPFEGDGDGSPIISAALRIPVMSLRSGSRATNELIRGAALLDAEAHSEITFVLDALRDPVQGEGHTAGGAGISGTAVGTLGFQGRDVHVEAPVEIEFLPFSKRTMFARYPGDLLTVRASFELSLDELGVKPPGPTMTDTLATKLRFDLFLVANTVTLEKSLDPAVSTEQLLKHLAFLTQLRDFNDPKAYELGRKLMAEFRDDAAALNRLANDVMNEDDIESRDLGFAEKCARRANELTEEKNAAFLDTLAEVFARQGDLSAAITWQKKAVESAAELPPPAAAGIRAKLERYEGQTAAASAAP